MQSASTRPFAPVPLAAALVVAAGLAGGIFALNATENLPGQSGSSASIARPAQVISAPNAGEGLVGPGSNVTDSLRPVTRGVPSQGQGEGLVGPGATIAPVVGGFVPFGPGEGFVGPGSAAMDSIKPVIRGIPSFGQGEGLVGPGADLSETSSDEYAADPYRGGITEQ